VWTLRYVGTNCTAVIWRNDFGLELRVEHAPTGVEEDERGLDKGSSVNS